MLDYDELHRLFKYEDGHLIRKITVGKVGKKGLKVGGKPTADNNKYMRVQIKGVTHYLHRVIFLMLQGYLPEFLDHIDGNKTNNKIENLRECTRSQNNQNKILSSNSTSGVKGVSWSKASSKWIAQVGVNGKNRYLGLFKTLEEAKQSVTRFRKEVHGNFANNG